MPRRAHLVIYGDITQVASTRLTHGLGRLLLVGNAQEFGSIPGSKVVASLPLQSNVIREHLGFEKRAESGTVHFEFGLVGLESIKGEIETFLCTAPNLETSRLFVGRHLGDFKLSTELQLGPLSLSWWERRGMGLSQG